MLDFHLTTEQEALQARVRAFAQAIVVSHVEEMERTYEYPWHVVKAMAEEG
jgi:hypothetical protein